LTYDYRCLLATSERKCHTSLDRLVGKTFAVRRDVLDGHFGEKGLVALSDEISVDTQVDALRSGVLTTAPAEFVAYFDRRLTELMRLNGTAGINTWTNNNSESMNHILKLSVHW